MSWVMAGAFLPESAAPIAAFTGDLWPEAETACTRRHPALGVARAEAQRRMAAGRLFCFALQSRAQPGGGK